MVSSLLWTFIQGDAPGGDEEDDRNEEGQHDHQDHGKAAVHDQGHDDAADQHHGRPDAERLELLDCGLDVVAVGGHAGNEARQAEAVELRAGEVGSFFEEFLPDFIADAVGVVHGFPVRRDVQLAADDGRGKHGESPQDDRRERSGRDDIVHDVFENIGDRQLGKRTQQLDENCEGGSFPITAQITEDQFHDSSFRRAENTDAA